MTRRRWSGALLAVTAEATGHAVSSLVRRPIGPSPAERRRFRRAEDRDLPPAYPRKRDCPGCVAARDADSETRWPVGDCSPWCLRRAARRPA